MIYFFFADGFEEMEALFPVDMLRRAGLPLETVSIQKTKMVTGTHNIKIECDILWKDVDLSTCDMAVFPGGMPGATNLDNFKGTDSICQTVYQNGGILAAICAAPLVLGHRGLLRGKHAICFPGFEKELDGAIIENQARVVVDGQFITSLGMGASPEFSVALARHFLGDEVKDLVAKAKLPQDIEKNTLILG